MIEIDGLAKSFGRVQAVRELTFSARPGEIVGMLGPNGAGKTTTLRMITGFLRPCRGRVSVCGYHVERFPQAAQRQMGYLPEGAPGYGDMTTVQFLNFVAEIRGLYGAAKRNRFFAMVDALELGPVLDRRIDELSKGYKRRVGLAQALIHDPRVLILDEPTDGLDPNQKQLVRDLIRRIAPDKIILVSTHVLEEVSAMCNRAIIIAAGRLVADGSPGQLAGRCRYDGAVTVAIEGAGDIAASLRALPAVLEVETDAERPGCFTLLVEQGRNLVPDVSALVHRRGWRLQALQVHSGHLDEVFRELTRTPAEVVH